MKTVCLVTSEESFLSNYGAALQGYALYKFIKELGYNVKILRYKGGDFEQAKQGKKAILKSVRIYTVKEICIKCLFRICKKLYIKDISKQTQMFQRFQDENMEFYPGKRVGWSLLKKDPPKADIYICGSDQIWNPMFKNGYNDPGYFLQFVREGRKVAYAPSFGIQDLPKTAQKTLKSYTEDIEDISVREEVGAQIMQKYAGRKVEVLLDPTLLFDKKDWLGISKIPNNIKSKYILSYRFGNSLEVSRHIKRIKSKLKLPIVVLPLSGVSFLNKRKTLNFEVGPSEFIGLIQNAELVCTDSFHATVFSIILETPFITFLRDEDMKKGEGMNSRIENLLEKVGLSNRVYNANNLLYLEENLLNINFVTAQNLLEKQRKNSRMWLKEAITR